MYLFPDAGGVHQQVVVCVVHLNMADEHQVDLQCVCTRLLEQLPLQNMSVLFFTPATDYALL